MQKLGRDAQPRLQIAFEQPAHFGKLCKDQGAVADADHLFEHFHQTHELAAAPVFFTGDESFGRCALTHLV